MPLQNSLLVNNEKEWRVGNLSKSKISYDESTLKFTAGVYTEICLCTHASGNIRVSNLTAVGVITWPWPPNGKPLHIANADFLQWNEEAVIKDPFCDGGNSHRIRNVLDGL